MSEDNREIVEEQSQINNVGNASSDISKTQEIDNVNGVVNQIPELETINNGNNQIPNNVTGLESKENNGKKNKIIIFLIFVIVLLLGGFLYYYFNHKDDKQGGGGTPVSTSTPVPSTPVPSTPAPTNNKDDKKEISKLTVNSVYKSKDGKSLKVTKIEEQNDEDGSWDDVYVTYDGKKYYFSVSSEDYKDAQYLSLYGDLESGSEGQCYSTGVLLNLKTKTIEKISTKGMYYYDIIKTNNGYFFTEAGCLGGYNKTVYDNNWKKLGRIIGTDATSDGHVYIFDNGNIIEYDVNGNKIAETKTSAKITGPGLIYNNTLYYLSTENDGTYFMKNNSNEKYKVDDEIKYKKGSNPYFGLDIEDEIKLELNNNKILIYFDPEEASYTYDINTKEIKKVS